MISQHTLSTGITIELERLEGHVASFNENHVTTVHQSDQYVVGQGFRPGLVSSGVDTIKKAWVRLDDGSERQFDFSELDVQAREGHRLTIVSGAAVHGDVPKQMIAVRNANMKLLYSAHIGGVNSANNDRARATWLPGIFRKEALVFMGVGAAVMALIVIGDGFFKGLLQGGFVGAIVGFIAWIAALLFKLSPARRREIDTYKQIELLAESMAKSGGTARSGAAGDSSAMGLSGS